MTTDRLYFRNDLQGLRAIAILLVIFSHAGLPTLPGGFIGVDIFFVLSGYLITGFLFRELEETGRIALSLFYARRLRRLFPALVLMIVITAGSTVWLLSGVEARLQLASAPYAVAWVSNLFFAFTSFDYFDDLSNRDLYLHTWSLAVEMQFYLIWPVVLLLLFRFSNAVQKTNKKPFSLMLIGLSIVCILSLILSLYWTQTRPQAAFYMMPSRIWQLALGAVIYFLCCSDDLHKLFIKKLYSHVLFGFGLLLILTSAVLLHPDLAYPGLWALFPSFGAAFIISAGAGIQNGQGQLLAHPALVWLGDRSYSIYLWHWPVLLLGFSLGFQDRLLPSLSMLLMTLLASIISYRLVELPFWKGRWRHILPLRIILFCLLLMAVSIAALYNGLRILPQPENSYDISNQWRRDAPVIYRMGCDAWYEHARVEPCVFGDEDANKTVVFLGDSIGAQWFSMIPEIFNEPQWRVIALTKSSCAIVDEDFFYSRIGKIYEVCTDWRNSTLDEINRIRPDVVIIGNSVTYDFSETQWLEGTSRILDRINDSKTKVIIIPGTPGLGFNGPGCASRNLSPDGSIDRRKCMARDRMQQVNQVTGFLEQAVSRYPHAHVLKLNDLICPDDLCAAINEEGVIVYRDSQHLTDTFVRTKIPVIRERMIDLYNSEQLSNNDAKEQ